MASFASCLRPHRPDPATLVPAQRLPPELEPQAGLLQLEARAIRQAELGRARVA